MLNSRVIIDYLLNRKNSLLENILMCLATTLTCAFFWYDDYYNFMSILRPVASVLLVVSWLWCGFLSGKDKKWGFLVFSGAYWLIPYLYGLWYKARDNNQGYNAFLSLSYKFSDLLFDKPMQSIAEFTHCGVYIWVLSLMILVCTVYFVGSNLSDIYRKKEQSENAENEAEEDEELPYDDENV